MWDLVGLGQFGSSWLPWRRYLLGGDGDGYFDIKICWGPAVSIATCFGFSMFQPEPREGGRRSCRRRSAPGWEALQQLQLRINNRIAAVAKAVAVIHQLVLSEFSQNRSVALTGLSFSENLRRVTNGSPLTPPTRNMIDRSMNGQNDPTGSHLQEVRQDTHTPHTTCVFSWNISSRPVSVEGGHVTKFETDSLRSEITTDRCRWWSVSDDSS